MLRIATVLLMAAGLVPAKDAHNRLNEARVTFMEIMSVRDKAIPQELLEKAECVVLVPGLKKGAFIVGGKYGRGFTLCRGAESRGWTAPASVRVEGGSFGFQIGGSETDVIMLVLNKRGVEKLLRSKFTLGGDLSVAAGPVGRTSSAKTDAFLHAEILTYSRSRGVFAGISLEGATLRPDEEANEELYGRKVDNKTILTGGVAAPNEAEPLIASLNKYSPRK